MTRSAVRSSSANGCQTRWRPPTSQDATLEGYAPTAGRTVVARVPIGRKGTVEQQEFDAVLGQFGSQKVVEARAVATQRALDDGDAAG
jgi:hypothetical protein